LIAQVKAENYKIMATATTGIAALLLFGGRTMHSALRIPLNVQWDTQPTIDYDSFLAEALRQLDVLIIDEISAGHKNVVNYIDKLLRSISPPDKENLKFGGKVVLSNCISINFYLYRSSLWEEIGSSCYLWSWEATNMLPSLLPSRRWKCSTTTK